MLKLKLAIFRLVVTFLNKAFLKVSHDEGQVKSWFEEVNRRCETRGTIDTIAWIKGIRLACTRWLCNAPLADSPGPGVELCQDGLPSHGRYAPVELFRSRDPSSLRLALTLLGVSRILTGWKSPDLSTVTQPTSGHDLAALGEDLGGLVRQLGWRITRPQWEECHVTTKSGPNAQALLSSIEDASLLSEEQISDLLVLGGDALVDRVRTVRLISPLAWLAEFGLKPRGVRSKLSLVRDKEAKTRIVAILDYWTQSGLKPLHDRLMSFLRSLKPDCTFNQGSFKVSLPAQGPYYSYDLSAATDRMPVSLQVPVLSAMVGSEEYAAAWERLITSREYSVTWGARGVVKYACGQPMGAYSSWSVFAVTHHAIVRLAAKRSGLNPKTFSNYALLGDDIVIANDAVAKEYRAILEQAGVAISEQKSHVSNDTYEFAKRWIHRGVEVTGAPLGSLFEAITFVSASSLKAAGGTMVPTKAIKRVSFYEVATWFREIEGRWSRRSEMMVSRGLLVSFFLLLGRAALSERLAEKCWKFYLLPSRDDSRLVRATKAEKLGLVLLPGSLGCFSWGRATERICVLLNECKARVIEEAIKRQFQALQSFQLEAAKYLKLMPEGLDAQSILLALPPFAALRRNIAELQLEFDKARRVRGADDVSTWLHLDVRLFLDPFAALSVRKSKTMASSKATVLNHLTAMCHGIERTRELAVTEISLTDLVSFIDNNHVTPSRGDRRRRKAPATRRPIPADITDVSGLGTKS